MEKTVVFEATSAEEGVKGVQRLLSLHRLRIRSIQVWGAEGRQLHWVRRLQQIPVPVNITRKHIENMHLLSFSFTVTNELFNKRT